MRDDDFSTRYADENEPKPATARPIDPPVGTRYTDGVVVVEWDGKEWREPASGRIA